MAVFIIAEAGVNHNGDVACAKRMIDAAHAAGCDAVKFQAFKAEKLVLKNAGLAKYQRANSPDETSQFDMLKKLELGFEEFEDLNAYCKCIGIQFMATPLDFMSADFLYELGMGVFKISSGDLNNMPFLRHVARFGKKIIISTGMGTTQDIYNAIGWIEKENNRNLAILHCTTDYPTAYNDVNLKAMTAIGERFGYPVGYSDHTLGIEVPIAAVALGATVIEKHFTLDRRMNGPDHKASSTVSELTEMVRLIRNVECCLGDGDKVPTQQELATLPIVRKSIVSAADIEEGVILTEDKLTLKRPGDGLEPKFWDDVVGRTTKRKIVKDTSLSWEDLV